MISTDASPMDALAQALWRYVTRDECDCACRRPVDWGDMEVPPPCADTSHDPCHFCTGFAALDVAGCDIAGCGLVEPGRHTASEIARLQAVPGVADFGASGL